MRRSIFSDSPEFCKFNPAEMRPPPWRCSTLQNSYAPPLEQLRQHTLRSATLRLVCVGAAGVDVCYCAGQARVEHDVAHNAWLGQPQQKQAGEWGIGRRRAGHNPSPISQHALGDAVLLWGH